MKVAIVGTRSFENFDLTNFLPEKLTEIVSGGADGVDSIARSFAEANGIEYTEFLPDYEINGKGAPLLRNFDIINTSDYVMIFWDGSSHGSRFVIEKCIDKNIPFSVYLSTDNGEFTDLDENSDFSEFTDSPDDDTEELPFE